jgi:CheY-like chemotaxis protein
LPSFRCPKCSAAIDAAPDAQGVVTCPQCGVKLRSKAPAAKPASAPSPAAAPAAPPPPARPAPTAAPVPVAAPRAGAPSPPSVTNEALLAEIRAVREVQEQILELLRSRPSASASGSTSDGFGFGMAIGMDDEDAPAGPPPASTPPMRSRRRKTVLLIDDDTDTRQLAAAALAAAEVPVRTVSEGQAALAAIAEEKPDVIALELDMGGSMGGKDVINMIKATMEWVDIPLVLYTRAAVASQKEARVIHGADDFVSKGPDGAALLVTRVISLFRRA